MRAPFITFEGGDGVGKSTQIARAAARLAASGTAHIATREPGGAPGAEAIRILLVEGAVDAFTPLAEALMMYAARAEHLARTINPARTRGDVVLCDRFADSTTAYQGAAGSVDSAALDALYRAVVGDDGPDLTIILDAPAADGLSRAAARRGEETRFERKGADYHARVRQAFLDIAGTNPQRCRVIDTTRPVDVVAADVEAACAPLLARWSDARALAGGG